MPIRTARMIALTVLAGALSSACTPSGSAGGPTAAPSAVSSGCSTLVNTMDGTEIARYAIPTGSRWWVSYAVLTNPCPEEVTLGAVEPVGPMKGSDMSWTGATGVLPASDPPDAFWPSSDDRAASAVAGYVVAPGAKVQLVAELVQASGNDPHGVPALTLRLAGAGTSGSSIELDPRFTFCSCQMPNQ